MFQLSKKIFALSISLTLGLLLALPLAVKANTVNSEQPNMILDNFQSFNYRTSGSIDFFMMPYGYQIPQTLYGPGGLIPNPQENEPYWWTIANNGWFQRAYNQECSPIHDLGYGYTTGGTECVSHMTENDENFMRLTVKPFVPLTSGEYHESALTEVNHGYSFYETKRWQASPSHPVTMIAKMRWSNIFNADGSGDFLGSSGIYLWNMPADYPNFTFHGVKAIGIDLLSDDSEMSSLVGLGVTYVNLDEPAPGAPIVYTPESSQKIQYTNVNIHDWVEFKMVWSKETGEDEKVKFWINENYVGEFIMVEPLPSLAVEAWNDNYVAIDNGDGSFTLTVGMYTAQQDFDVDFIKVMQN